jgi:hypothetical protein
VCIFDSAEGLQAGQSHLRFKDLTLGTVTGLDLTADHSRAIATIATTPQATPLLTDQTVFWVVRPRLSPQGGFGTLLEIARLPAIIDGTLFWPIQSKDSEKTVAGSGGQPVRLLPFRRVRADAEVGRPVGILNGLVA